jgi:hypothetical protein
MPNTSRDKLSTFAPNPKSKLFEQVREVMRFHHYSYRTEKTYLQRIRRYLAFHRSRQHVARKFGRRGLRRPAGAVARGPKAPLGRPSAHCGARSRTDKRGA